jgi:asparagine synthase (glutamine-hydrolysing)
MCGIAGYIGDCNEKILNQMIQKIKYRGPNGQHLFVKNDVGFAHARLSILDLRQEGNQPMFNLQGNLMITFNGEIYNFLELKKKLKDKYKFVTTTDTEVLLYMYMEYGEDMFDHIHGMFAFAIHDFEKNTTLIARDRLGKKPLYYSHVKNTFLFASELKAILEYPEICKKLNIESINQYLTFDYIPTPNTIIDDIYKLEPSTYLILEKHKVIKKVKFWSPEYTTNHNIKFNYAKTKLDILLNEAVSKRLISDVPLGVFLSGGLDSSAIAYYAQKNSKYKIKTFSIGFQDKSYNESDFANQVASHLKTDHHSKILTSKHTLELIDEILPNLDEPFADASIIPTYFLSKFSKQYVDVTLGGDGSDELLAGYPTFISDNFKFPLNIVPKYLINILISISNNTIPISHKNISIDFKINQFLKGFLGKNSQTHQLWLGSFDPIQKRKIFRKEVYDNLLDKPGLNISDKHYNFYTDNNIFQKNIHTYLNTYLLDDILYKVDRASMLNSLEVRAPFLDTHVVEFINTLPKNFKLNGFEGKYILKKIMEDKLPKNIIYRNKKGFGIPLSNWIKFDLKNEISNVLKSAPEELFNLSEINKILSDHLNNKRNNRKLIWNLYVLIKYIKINKLNS